MVFCYLVVDIEKYLGLFCKRNVYWGQFNVLVFAHWQGKTSRLGALLTIFNIKKGLYRNSIYF